MAASRKRSVPEEQALLRRLLRDLARIEANAHRVCRYQVSCLDCDKHNVVMNGAQSILDAIALRHLDHVIEIKITPNIGGPNAARLNQVLDEGVIRRA